MTNTTARLGLPLIAPGQAQKEMFHNESLAAIDAMLHAAVEAVGALAPPTVATPGQSWILGAEPVREWAGRAHHLASWTDGGWRFHPPAAGMGVTLRPSGVPVSWYDGAWRVGEARCERLVVAGKQVVGARGPAVSAPTGGTTVDGEARAVLESLLGALREHGLIG
ncbi:MAG TPA: DUF2793 domain-containing protein [Sphingomonadaceae bacterium]|nr:DUF2793 domain-containing protein [Sphingomonadaceae bacterium]